jgi:hypothetical protein
MFLDKFDDVPADRVAHVAHRDVLIEACRFQRRRVRVQAAALRSRAYDLR